MANEADVAATVPVALRNVLRSISISVDDSDWHWERGYYGYSEKLIKPYVIINRGVGILPILYRQ